MPPFFWTYAQFRLPWYPAVMALRLREDASHPVLYVGELIPDSQGDALVRVAALGQKGLEVDPSS